MARVEQLIEQIEDEGLRRDLEREVALMKKRVAWGLVFERHLPESTLVLNGPIKRGSVVYERRTRKPVRLRVTEVAGDELTVVPEAEPGKTLPKSADTAPRTMPRADVLVSVGVGEPVYPALTSLGTERRGPADKPAHAVISGENFHALQLLVDTYEGQVDFVYLDPPYNSGARDWKYNNDFVDAKDAWRHSKWLAFMERRLRLAKRLLRPDGVLVVTIDENEVFHLGMLLEQLFSEYLHQMVTIVINPKGTGKLNFARVEEHALFCIPNTGRSVIRGLPKTVAATADEQTEALLEAVDAGEEGDVADEAGDEDENGNGEGEPEQLTVDDADLPFPPEEVGLWERRHARRRGGESSYRHQRPNQFYPLWIDEAARKVVRAGDALPLEERPDFTVVDGLTPVWPIDNDGNDRCWGFVPETMNTLIAASRVVLGKQNPRTGRWTVNYWVRSTSEKKLKTVWWVKEHDAGTHGTTLLNTFLGSRGAFSFPKSVYAVRDTLATVVRDRPNALIVDFFGGSGTTLHATWMLNQEDGGRRRCVLVTNNEVADKVANRLMRDKDNPHFPGDPEFEAKGVFESAARPRLEAALTGLRPDGTAIPGSYVSGRPYASGYEENVEFFRLDYLDPVLVELGRCFEALYPSMWLRAGGIGEREPLDTAGRFAIANNSPYAVLFDPSGMPGLLDGLAVRPDISWVFIVADTDHAYADLASTMPHGVTTVQLYRSYLDTVRSAIA